MRTLVEELPSEKRISLPGTNYIPLRVTCWCVALLLGAVQAWATRFTMNPDGVSYLDIGDAYWRGDWHNAISPYWSPVYSWILGLFLMVFKPTMYWEYPLVHLVNFLLYVISLGCFEFFLSTFIQDRKQRNLELQEQGQIGLSQGAWWILGYSLFISCSIALIGLRLVMPDFCVAAVVYLASAFLIRIANHSASRLTYAVLGAVLGIGYLSKSVLFPLSIVFLITALTLNYRKWKNIAVSALIFASISMPFVLAISAHKGRLTIGESGRWNYLVFVDGVKPFLPQAGPPLEHPKRILQSPNVYDYSGVSPATCPPWFDPSYWQEGIPARPDIRRQLSVIGLNLSSYWHLVSDTFLHRGYTIVFLLVTFVFASRPRLRDVSWYLLAPSVAALGAFSLLLVLYRYVAPFVLLVWLVLFDGLRFPVIRERQRLVQFAIICASALALILPVVQSILGVGQRAPATYPEAAESLHAVGIQRGDAVAMIWNEDWESDALTGIFIPRLLRARIVGEAEPARVFWSSSKENQQKVLGALFGIGVKAIIARNPPAGSIVDPCWRQLGKTEFSACLPLTARLPQSAVRRIDATSFARKIPILYSQSHPRSRGALWLWNKRQPPSYLARSTYFDTHCQSGAVGSQSSGPSAPRALRCSNIAPDSCARFHQGTLTDRGTREVTSHQS